MSCVYQNALRERRDWFTKSRITLRKKQNDCAKEKTSLAKFNTRLARNKTRCSTPPKARLSTVVLEISPRSLGLGLSPPHTSKKNLTLSFKFESHSAFFSLARALGDSRPWWSGGESGGDESHKILNVKELSYPVLVFPSPFSPRFFSLFFSFLFLSLFFFPKWA